MLPTNQPPTQQTKQPVDTGENIIGGDNTSDVQSVNNSFYLSLYMQNECLSHQPQQHFLFKGNTQMYATLKIIPLSCEHKNIRCSKQLACYSSIKSMLPQNPYFPKAVQFISHW